ncbi:MAG: MFS transporter [Anaerolineae bacterium]
MDEERSLGSRLANLIGVNRAVLALSIGRMGDGIGNSLLFIVVPLFVAKLPAPSVSLPETVRAGIVISLFGLIASLGQPFAGAVIDRVNRRKPFVVGGLLLLCAATASFALASRFSHLLILRGVQGLGVAIAIPPTLALLTNSTKKESRGGSMGIFSTFRVSGLAVGPLLGGFVNDHYGFDTTFFVGAAFTLAGAILVQILVKEIRLDPSEYEVREFRLLDTSLLSASLVSLGFATFIMAVSFTLIAPLEQEINKQIGQTAAAFGLAFSALMLTRILVQVPLGRVSDRIGRKPLIVAGLVLMAIATVPMGLVQTTAELAGLRVLQGIASAGIAAPVFALAGDMSSHGGEGRQMSIVTMGFGLGAALGTLFAGILAVYSLALPFFVAGGASLLVALLVFYFVHEPAADEDRKNEE